MVELYRKGDFQKLDRRKSDRRVHPRYVFFAECDLTELSSGSRYEARVTEISLGGCFVDLLVPLLQGTDLRLRITKEDRTFEAPSSGGLYLPFHGKRDCFYQCEPGKPADTRRLDSKFAALV